MADVVQIIESLGGLHDAKVDEMLWLSAERRLELEIRDLYANFAGLPEYLGPARGRFIFSQVSKLYSEDVDLAEVGLMIYDWTFRQLEAPGYSCEILLSPGGKMLIECGHIECVQGNAG